MSKDRDIDDILESLNQLLRDGESHNDDLEASAPDLDHQSQQLAETVRQLENIEAVTDQQHDGAVSADDEPHEAAESEEEIVDPNSEAVQKVVLTEEMLVDNPQGSLLNLLHGRETIQGDERQADRTSEEQAPQPASQVKSYPVSDELIAEITREVSQELIDRLQDELPQLVARALNSRLKELKRDE